MIQLYVIPINSWWYVTLTPQFYYDTFFINTKIYHTSSQMVKDERNVRSVLYVIFANIFYPMLDSKFCFQNTLHFWNIVIWSMVWKQYSKTIIFPQNLVYIRFHFLSLRKIRPKLRSLELIDKGVVLYCN